MAGIPRLSRRARWAVPAGALVITGGVIAGSVISVAQAAPGLPARTAAQLLAEAADSVTPPLTGTVVETASFGLPALPATGNPTSLSSLLTGSHTVRVWYASPEPLPAGRAAVAQRERRDQGRQHRLALAEHPEPGHQVHAPGAFGGQPASRTEAAADPAAGGPAGAGRGRADHHGQRGQQRDGGRAGRLWPGARAEGRQVAGGPDPDRHRRQQRRAAPAAGLRPGREQPRLPGGLHRHSLRDAGVGRPQLHPAAGSQDHPGQHGRRRPGAAWAMPAPGFRRSDPAG